jgi:hypothetical protein
VLDERNIRLRALAAVLEPVVASVYFSPEAHEALNALGFGPTGGIITGNEWAEKHWGACYMPDYTAYISGRGAHMGNPSAEVVAATFGIFQPAMVIAMWKEGRTIASPEATRAARESGAIAQLERLLGARPAGIDRVNELLERAGEGLPHRQVLRRGAGDAHHVHAADRRARARHVLGRRAHLHQPLVRSQRLLRHVVTERCISLSHADCAEGHQ